MYPSLSVQLLYINVRIILMPTVPLTWAIATSNSRMPIASPSSPRDKAPLAMPIIGCKADLKEFRASSSSKARIQPQAARAQTICTDTSVWLICIARKDPSTVRWLRMSSGQYSAMVSIKPSEADNKAGRADALACDITEGSKSSQGVSVALIKVGN